MDALPDDMMCAVAIHCIFPTYMSLKSCSKRLAVILDTEDMWKRKRVVDYPRFSPLHASYKRCYFLEHKSVRRVHMTVGGNITPCGFGRGIVSYTNPFHHRMVARDGDYNTIYIILSKSGNVELYASVRDVLSGSYKILHMPEAIRTMVCDTSLICFSDTNIYRIEGQAMRNLIHIGTPPLLVVSPLPPNLRPLSVAWHDRWESNILVLDTDGNRSIYHVDQACAVLKLLNPSPEDENIHNSLPGWNAVFDLPYPGAEVSGDTPALDANISIEGGVSLPGF